ncbi:DUF7489 domain-containing protein [Actinoplanes sp. CA-054009]
MKKSRGLMDGSNLYRRLKVRLDDGAELDVKVDREVWDRLEVGDQVAKEEGGSPQPVSR